MQNKIITIYELMGLIKDGKAPKQIKIGNHNLHFNGDYAGIEDMYYSDYDTRWINVVDIKLNTKVEILPEENEMKEMIYQADRKTEVLYHGFYKDYEFYIMNLGPHPTAYVNVFNNNLLVMKDYDDINIDVHGGLTYSKDFLCINDKSEKVKGWFIGWDYAHYDDFDGCEISMPEEIRINGNKWTTEEIFEDVKSVIEQCINYEENDEWEDIEECSKKEFLDLTSDEKSLELYCYIRDLIKNQKYLKEKLESKDE